MIEIKREGHESVKIFAETVEQEAIEQIKKLSTYPPYLDNRIRIMPDCHAGAGCTIGTTMKLDGSVTANLVGVDISCLDKDTEVLTPTGWIKISNYTDQEILEYDSFKKLAKFSKPLAYIKAPCETFYKFHNKKGLDQVVSEEHRMLVVKTRYEAGSKKETNQVVHPSFFQSIEKENLEKGYYRCYSAFNLDTIPGLELSDDLIRIDIMIQADGRIRYNKTAKVNHVELHFKKTRKIERARLLLNNARIPFKELTLKDGSTLISFNISTDFNKNLTKYYRASKEQLSVVCEECLNWDGHEGYRSYYYSMDKESADVIQFAFSSNNIRAGIYTNPSGCHQVIPTKNNTIGYTVNPEIVKSEDGFKYCFTTNTGYFVARRNNNIFITGNCGMLAIQLDPKTHRHGIELEKLDKVIHSSIPAGFEIHPEAKDNCAFLDDLRCGKHCDLRRAARSIGTLGGGEELLPG